MMWAKLRRQIWQWRGVLIAAPSVASVLIGLRLTGSLQPLELAALDQFFQMRPLLSAEDRIVIVEINESDIQASGQWPISDAKMAQLIKTLKKYQPQVIGLDIYRDLEVQPGHQELVQVFASTPNLIGIKKVIPRPAGKINPPPTLSQLGQVSASDLVIDADGTIRRSLLSLKDENSQTVFSLGAKLALKYLENKGITFQTVAGKPGAIKLGKANFVRFEANDGGYVGASAGGYQILSSFRGLKQGFRTISMTDVLQKPSVAAMVRDRIVLIGITAESVKDSFRTPYSSGLGQPLLTTSGVQIHAEVTSQIVSAALDGYPLMHVCSKPVEWLWIFSCAVVGAVLSWTQRYRIATQKFATGMNAEIPLTATCITLVGLSLVGGSYLAFLSGLWVPIVPGFIALIGSASVITADVARTAATMRRIFGRYLTDQVVANLLETPFGLKLGGENRKVTILVSDIRQFSNISERVAPQTAVAIINLYLEEMTEVINQYQGMIVDFIGDSIFTMFGTPIEQEDDAQRAVACAIAMQLAMEKINSKLAQKSLPNLEMGIGLHTGDVVAGNIGSQKRAKYTVFGNNVNLAFRIETYTVGGQVLISQQTLKAAGAILRVDGVMRVQPKGFAEGIHLYKIGGIGGQFNLSLNDEDDILIELGQEIPLHYQVIQGKQLTGEIFQGCLIKLSANTAELRLEYPVELLSNLQINLVTGTEKARGLGDIYAKVVDISNYSQNQFCVRFTAVPPDISALLYYLRSSFST
jgi:adenylate cyclase